MNRKRSLKRAAVLFLVVILIVPGSTMRQTYAADTVGLRDSLTDTTNAISDVMNKTDDFTSLVDNLETAYNSLQVDAAIQGLEVTEVTDNTVTLKWDPVTGENAEGMTGYHLYWADKDTALMKYKQIAALDVTTTTYTFNKSTHKNHYFKVAAVYATGEAGKSDSVKSPTQTQFNVQLEQLNRSLVATYTDNGIFLSWRLMADEVTGYSDTGLVGTNFNVYCNGNKLATVEDSTNYLHEGGDGSGTYYVTALDEEGNEINASEDYAIFANNENYIDIPIQAPAVEELPPMVLTDNASYSYTANDVSVGDVDGDGEYEYIVKWYPSNSKDVSQRGYTGKTYFDCYKLDGTLLWRIDMGYNIRSGAHYTQFVVADLNGDGTSEISMQTAPGTKITIYNPDGSVKSDEYITIPAEDVADGVSDTDDYRMSAGDYKAYFTESIMHWGDWDNEFWTKNSSASAIEARKKWDKNIENLWWYMYEQKYAKGEISVIPEHMVGKEGPYTQQEAEKLVDLYYSEIQQYKAPANNRLEAVEGFILTGPEYVTVFDGSGDELDTQPVQFPREDDGLLWGDYEWDRIEPANRSERHNAGAAYLDGENLYLVMGRGYYTRSTIAAYTLNSSNKLESYWDIDSGWVEMENPFFPLTRSSNGNDPVNGTFAGQGDHTISFADVDGDGKQEVIYGGAIVDHDGTLYSSGMDYLPNGTLTKYGHGDSLHTADIDPDRPGLEIFSCFENGASAPYGTALRDAETNTTIFGDYSGADTGRCMVSDLFPQYRGLETWGIVNRTAGGVAFAGNGIGSDQNIRWSADMTTSIYSEQDNIEGYTNGVRTIQLAPTGTASNNGTKRNAGLIADVLGDWREELVVRTTDSSALRIYISDEVTDHKLYTLMQDPQYRAQVTAQQSAYNQPSYTSYYLASDTDWEYVWVPNITPDDLVNHQEEKVIEKDIRELPTLPDETPKTYYNVKFDIGTKFGAAEGFIGIDESNHLYTEEQGYGFDRSSIEDSSFSYNTNYNNDILYGESASAIKGVPLIFYVDVPNGTYNVDMYLGGTSNGFGTVLNVNGETLSGDDTAKRYLGDKGNRIITLEDVEVTEGQIIINATGANKSSQLSGIVVTSTIAEETSSYTKEFQESTWRTIAEAVLLLDRKISMMSEDSYDVSVVEKMLSLQAGLKEAEGMCLVDFTGCKELFDTIAALDSNIYTTSSYNAMVDVMEEICDVATQLMDILKITSTGLDTLEFLLMGVTIPEDSKYFSLFLDFGLNGSASSTFGYVDFYGNLSENLYQDSNKGYGLESIAAGRNRGGDSLLGDFIMDNTLYIDIPTAGNYILDFLYGDSIASNTTTVTVSMNDQTLGSFSKNTASGAFGQSTLEILAEETGTLKIQFGGRINALRMEEIINVDLGKADTSELKALAAYAKGIERGLYTPSTLNVLDAALETAEGVLTMESPTVQQVVAALQTLKNALDGLTLISELEPFSKILIDFGTEGSAVADGYLQGRGEWIYGENHLDTMQSLGFDRVMPEFEQTQNNPGAYFRDYVYSEGGESYTFKVDLIPGDYEVYVYTGEKMLSNTTKVIFQNETAVYDQTSAGGGQYPAANAKYLVTVKADENDEFGTLTLTLFDDTAQEGAISARLNGLEIVKKDDVVTATSLSFEQETVNLETGDTFSQPASVSLDANNRIAYSSSNTSVATVDVKTGNVTAISEGEAIITAQTAGITATYKVVVVEAETETEIETETETEIETEVETETETEIETETETETQIETETETETETQIETETETQVETETETETETQIETESETETQIETESETETQIETDTQVATDTRTETQKETKVNTTKGNGNNTKGSGPSGTGQKPANTGDNTNVLMFMGLLMTSSITGMIVIVKKRNKTLKEKK